MKYLSGTSGEGRPRGIAGGLAGGIANPFVAAGTPREPGDPSRGSRTGIAALATPRAGPSKDLAKKDLMEYLQTALENVSKPDIWYEYETGGWEELKANAHEDDPYPGNNPVEPEPEDDDPGLGDPWIGPGSMW